MNKRQCIRIAGGFSRTIRVRIVAPGLAVHKTLYVAGLRGDEPVLPWTITHIPTGSWIALAKTQPQARKIVAAIKDLADWPNLISKGPPDDKREAIRQAIRAIKEER